MKEVVRQEKHIGYVYIPIDGGNIEDCSRAIDTFPHWFDDLRAVRYSL